MKKSFIFLVVLLSSVVYPQGKQASTPDSSVVLSGDDYSFAITIPAGWRLESGVGTWSGNTAILYPKVSPTSRIHWGNPRRVDHRRDLQQTFQGESNAQESSHLLRESGFRGSNDCFRSTQSRHKREEDGSSQTQSAHDLARRDGID